MQNRYVGDVGDFGKYGLLRALTSGRSTPPDLRLAVVWYLTETQPSDPRGDGRHIAYLEAHKERDFLDCDPDLYREMREIVRLDQRDVASIQRRAVLPEGTTFVDHMLRPPKPWSAVEAERRAEARVEWLRQAVEAVERAQLTFLDPDNGLEIASVRPLDKAATKHAFFNEVAAFAGDGDRSIIIYHHLPHVTTEVEIEWRKQQLAELLPRAAEPFALRFHAYSARAYFVVPSVEHEAALRERADAMLETHWGKHFDRTVY